MNKEAYEIGVMLALQDVGLIKHGAVVTETLPFDTEEEGRTFGTWSGGLLGGLLGAAGGLPIGALTAHDQDRDTQIRRALYGASIGGLTGATGGALLGRHWGGRVGRDYERGVEIERLQRQLLEEQLAKALGSKK